MTKSVCCAIYAIIIAVLFSTGYPINAQTSQPGPLRDFGAEPLPESLVDALIKQKSAQHDAAFPLASEFVENSKSDNPLHIAIGLHIMAQALWANNNLEEAYNCERGAVEILARLETSQYLSSFPDVATFFLEAANLAYELRRYEEAKNIGSAYLYILNFGKDLNPAYQRNFLLCLYVVMKSYSALGKHDKALSYFTILNSNNAAPTDSEECKCLIFNIFGVASDEALVLGQAEQAIFLAQSRIVLASEMFGDSDLRTYTATLQLATALSSASKYTEANQIYKTLISTMELNRVTNTTEYLLALVSYASLLNFSINDVDTAKEYVAKAESLAEQQKISGEDAYNVYRTLSMLRMSFGQNEVSEAMKRKAELFKPGTSIDDADEMTALADLVRSGNIAEAKNKADIMLKRYEAVNDTLSEQYYSTLYTHTVIQVIAKEPEADVLIEKTRNRAKQIYGEHSLTYLSALTPKFLSILLKGNLSDNDKNVLTGICTEYVDICSELLPRNFMFLAAAQRVNFWENTKLYLTKFVPVSVLINPSPKSIQTAYRAALITKGLLLNADIGIAEILAKGDTEASVSEKMSKLADDVRAMVNKNGTISDEDFLAVFNRVTEVSPRCAELQHKLVTSPEDVKKALKPDEMAVEFVWFPLDDDKDNSLMLALIMKNSNEYPKAVPVMNSKIWNEIKRKSLYTDNQLTTAVWGTLNKFADGIKNIYFAPDGPFYSVAIESMPDFEKTDKLISDRWNIYRVSSTRELAARGKGDSHRVMSMFGGMKYDAAVSVVSDGDSSRSLSDDFLDASGLRGGVNYLPETLNEVNSISKIMDSAKVKYSCITGDNATESNFKKLSAGLYTNVHVATHGFYWTDNQTQNLTNLSFLKPNVGSDKEDFALSRSGLLFSGANDALSGKPIPAGCDDGVLTAKEIALLDLDKVNLLVLSACETGLGDITAEGVFGLQRGFKKAGVKSMIMSLWKVDDKATGMLMTKFYEELMSGKSKHESLISAQKYLREFAVETASDSDEEMTAAQKRRNRINEDEPSSAPESAKIEYPYRNPKFWAAFILLDGLE